MTHKQASILAIHFPYCVMDLDPELRMQTKRWVILNRNYKPCGYFGWEEVDYSHYAVRFPRISSRSIHSVSVPSNAHLKEGEKTFWFYTVHAVSLLRSPRELSDYIERIRKFSCWEIKYPYRESELPYGYQPPDHRPRGSTV